MDLKNNLVLAKNLANLSFLLAGLIAISSLVLAFKGKKKSFWKTLLIGLGVSVGIVVLTSFVNYLLVLPVYDAISGK